MLKLLLAFAATVFCCAGCTISTMPPGMAPANTAALDAISRAAIISLKRDDRNALIKSAMDEARAIEVLKAFHKEVGQHSLVDKEPTFVQDMIIARSYFRHYKLATADSYGITVTCWFRAPDRLTSIDIQNRQDR